MNEWMNDLWWHERKRIVCITSLWRRLRCLSNQRFGNTSNWYHKYSVYVLRLFYQRSQLSFVLWPLRKTSLPYYSIILFPRHMCQIGSIFMTFFQSQIIGTCRCAFLCCLKALMPITFSSPRAQPQVVYFFISNKSLFFFWLQIQNFSFKFFVVLEI